MTVTDRVQQGVAWLDANGPDRWWTLVELLELDLTSGCSCVLGQVFLTAGEEAYQSGFSRGVEIAKDQKGFTELEASDWTIESGFDAVDEYEDFMVRADFVALTAEWTKVINERNSL